MNIKPKQEIWETDAIIWGLWGRGPTIVRQGVPRGESYNLVRQKL